MKHFNLSVTSLVLGLALSSVTYAHVSLKGEDIPVVKATYDWSGFYGGLNVGAVNHTMNITDINAQAFYGSIQQVSNPRLTGGLQVGYRYQLELDKCSGVFGLEVSGDFANTSFKQEYGAEYPDAYYNAVSKNELKNVWMLEATGGVEAYDTLLFLAAGISWSNISGSWANTGHSYDYLGDFNVSKKVFGAAIGAGVEYAINDTFSLRFKADAIMPNTYSVRDTHDPLCDCSDHDVGVSNMIVLGTFGVNMNLS